MIYLNNFEHSNSNIEILNQLKLTEVITVKKYFWVKKYRNIRLFV